MPATSPRAQRVSAALILGFLLVAPAARAEIPPELNGLPVVEVVLGGDAAPRGGAETLGIAHGAPLGRGLIRSAIRRLLDTGRFADVQVDAEREGDGVKLLVWVTPRMTLQRIEPSGNAKLDDASIREALRLNPGDEVSPAQMQELAGMVAKLYAERGYLDARVETALHESRDPSAKVLVVAIREGAPTHVRSLRFEGEAPLDPEATLASMDISRGDVLDRRQLQSSMAKAEAFLRERGFLEAALGPPITSFEGDQADVRIPSSIGPRYEVQVQGYTGFNRSEIVGVLGLEHERLTETLLTQSLPERLQDFYARRGFADARIVLSRGAGKRRGSAVLYVNVERGQQRHVVAVSFAGARHFSRDFLQAQLSSYLGEELPGSSWSAPVDSEVADQLWMGRPSGRPRALPAPPITDPEQIYYEPVYKKAAEHIAELYHGDGYLTARVGPVQVQHIGKERSAVLIPVVEGPRTLLHQVAIHGAQAMSARDLLLAAQLRTDEPFSYLLLEQARRRVLEAYQERGYMFASCNAEVHFSSDRTRAEVELQVVELYPVHVRQLVILGADRTDESLIRRIVKLQPGDLFRPSLARESERDLSHLQVFSGVSIGLKEPELASRVKTVIVTVSERRNQFLGFSAGVSTGQGVRAGFEYGYRNLFGQALGLTLRTQFAYQPFFVDSTIQRRFEELTTEERLERRISLGTTIPRLPGLGRVRTSLDLVHLRSNERDFGIKQYAVGLTFTHPTTEQLTLTLGGDLENNEVKLFLPNGRAQYLTDPRLRRLLRVSADKLLPADGGATLIAARSSLSYDRRDSAFTPSRGFFLTAVFELARTLSSEKHTGMVDEFFSRFAKVSLTGSGYIPLGQDIVLAGQARIGRIFHLHHASKTYPTRAFFLGGVDSLRGYLEDELIPQDVAEVESLDPNAIVRSGDAFVLYRAELRFPLYRELRGGLFSDLGNLWADASNLDPIQLRPTAGVGLRYDTPVGPLAFDLGINLNPRRSLHERAFAFHFAIGLF